MNKKDLHELALSRMEEAVEAERGNREEALDDLENLAGRQWPEAIKDEREDANRPCLTVNRLPQFVRQVTGDLRNMNPAINVIPGDDKTSEDDAEIVEGLIRHIQYRSDASSVYERAAESAASCGMGYFRIRADYVDGESFNQEILIESIQNPFSVYTDPAAKLPTREDMGYCFILEHMAEKDFEDAYPNAEKVEFDADDNVNAHQEWRCDGDITIAEYFYKEPVEKTLYLMADGTVLEKAFEGMNYVRKRTVEDHKVMWCKISGKEVLEGPQEVAGKHIPVVAVLGEELHLGEEVVRTSVIRFAKDPQRLYNYWRSAQTELVALQPKAPYIVTAKQVAGLESFWNEANDSNRPYLPYNPDEKAPPPQRAMPPVASQGMMQEVLAAAEDMKSTTGIFDAGLGNRSNEQSGVAIRQRQIESDVSTSIYADNMGKAIECAGKIILSMIPKVYDTFRNVRVMAADDTEKLVPINGVTVQDGYVTPVNDMRSGNFSVRVTVGPNYSTKRQETAESMISFVQAFPAAAPVVGDLVAKHMDWPGADEFAERLKKMLPPGMADDEENGEVMMLQQQIEQLTGMLQQIQQEPEMRKATAEASEAEADADKARTEALSKQLELSIQSGQLNEVIQEAVARALMVGASQPGLMPL